MQCLTTGCACSEPASKAEADIGQPHSIAVVVDAEVSPGHVELTGLNPTSQDNPLDVQTFLLASDPSYPL